ncbi:hypothetical protein BRC64_00685 [Halobacteriales archaeon QH_10_67_22]|nr:MAG: hypothetical protein BRC64_00685 [Halobacteriales archaeon QH_10_67_22]
MVAVTVVLPTYNREHRLRYAVESVLDQTYTNLECIVVDGGSTDDTPTMLESFDDDRLRVIRRTEPQGLSSARNAGLELASGEYIVFLDDDDAFYDTAIETLVRTIREQPENCAGVYTAHRRVDESGDSTTERVTGGKVDRLENARIGGPSCTLIKAEIFDVIGPFDESFPACEDEEFWLRLFDEFYMFAIDTVLYKRHYHGDQMTNDLGLMLEGRARLLEKHGEKLSDQYQEHLQYSLAHGYARLGRTEKARAFFRGFTRKYPLRLAYYYYYVWLLFGVRGYDLGKLIHHRLYRPVVDRFRAHLR